MIKRTARQTWARIGHSGPQISAPGRIQPHITRLGKITIGPGSSQLTGRFHWWWQVQGSNLGRLSRRFYSETAGRPGIWPLAAAIPSRGLSAEAAVSSWLREPPRRAHGYVIRHVPAWAQRFGPAARWHSW